MWKRIGMSRGTVDGGSNNNRIVTWAGAGGEAGDTGDETPLSLDGGV